MLALDGDDEALGVTGLVFSRKKPVQLRVVGGAIGPEAEPFQFDGFLGGNLWVVQNADAVARGIGIECALRRIQGDGRSETFGFTDDVVRT